jgi:F-type H+-transporting ATPase subunit epsilon
MSNPLNFTIYTANGLVFEGDVLWAYLPSTKGPLGILPGHTPIVAALADKGVIRLETISHELRFFAVYYGAVEVKKDKTLILSEECLSAPSLSEAEAILSKPSEVISRHSPDVLRAKIALQTPYAKPSQTTYNKK